MADQTGGAPNLKRQIRNGEKTVGVMVTMDLDRGALEAVLAKRSYDFVWTDTHSYAFNQERLRDFFAIVNQLNIPGMVRIESRSDAYLIGKYLDLGASGIMIPQVEYESTVEEAMLRFYYPPVGDRGWGGSPRVGLGDHGDRLEYASWWNEYGVLWLQLESVNAVTNVRELAKAGVDCVSFGATDLTFSLETHPQYPIRTVDDCVRNVVSQLKGAGVAVGYTSGTPEGTERYAAMGTSLFLEGPLA